VGKDEKAETGTKIEIGIGTKILKINPGIQTQSKEKNLGTKEEIKIGIETKTEIGNRKVVMVNPSNLYSHKFETQYMKFKNITFKLLAVGCLVIGLASCGEKPTYLEFQDVPSSNWNYSDTLSYTITLEEAVDNPEVELVVRNSADYPFQNFWVQVDQYQDSIKIAEFKHEVMLANPAGRWIGKKSGTLYTSYNYKAFNLLV